MHKLVLPIVLAQPGRHITNSPDYNSLRAEENRTDLGRAETVCGAPACFKTYTWGVYLHVDDNDVRFTGRKHSFLLSTKTCPTAGVVGGVSNGINSRTYSSLCMYVCPSVVWRS